MEEEVTQYLITKIQELAKILDTSNNREYEDWEGDSDGTSSNE